MRKALFISIREEESRIRLSLPLSGLLREPGGENSSL
jgi:hypothetical protein